MAKILNRPPSYLRKIDKSLHPLYDLLEKRFKDKTFLLANHKIDEEAYDCIAHNVIFLMMFAAKDENKYLKLIKKAILKGRVDLAIQIIERKIGS